MVLLKIPLKGQNEGHSLGKYQIYPNQIAQFCMIQRQTQETWSIIIIWSILDQNTFDEKVAQAYSPAQDTIKRPKRRPQMKFDGLYPWEMTFQCSRIFRNITLHLLKSKKTLISRNFCQKVVKNMIHWNLIS